MNPDRIRVLLDGITAGEWRAEPDDEDDALWWLSIPDQPFDHEYKKDTAAFIAASPGIARYALELAAENERLRGALDKCVSYFGDVKSSLSFDSDIHGAEYSAHEGEQTAIAALAPQPAPTDVPPTDGVESVP